MKFYSRSLYNKDSTLYSIMCIIHESLDAANNLHFKFYVKMQKERYACKIIVKNTLYIRRDKLNDGFCLFIIAII
ncbi:unnamed protein product [Paramecium octaurelia]|uniref:Uncharacterized protein n=1 Tax=Paramecium octaurelia TaxID=43137 RepID=A0A8S1S9I3_PAROT|nr:unnamed protein product [Paramecium octaurelia]